MDKIRAVGEKCKDKAKQWSPVFITCMILSIAIYYMFLSKGLVNSDDGLWEYNYYKAGRWSLSLGRWFWIYLDRFRFDVSTEPISSLLALACYSAGLVIMLDLYDVKITDKVAFLVNALIKMDRIWSAVIAGSILIAFSTGIYQAYISCTCITLVGYFLLVLCDNKVESKTVVRDILKSVLVLVMGGALYFIILQLHLTVFHVALSDYNGANTYSLMNSIKNLLFSIQYTYRVFSRYYLENYFKVNVLREFKIYWIMFLFTAAFFIRKLVYIAKRSAIRAFIFALFIAAIPVASNAVLLIATGVWVSLHMMVAMALCIPVLVCRSSGPHWKDLVVDMEIKSVSIANNAIW